MPGIDECLLEAMTLPGARGAAVVDWTSGLALGAVGDPAGGDHETTAAETAELARMAAEHTAFAAPGAAGRGEPGKGDPVEDLIVTTRTGYHLLRFVERVFDAGLFVHLWLDRDDGNLALARIRLRHLAERLVLA
ncbi:hypothetical protein [Streptomyces macrosporus]|uniref:Roadblock/LAMTOR2 domain-containing protein n=1 Tax=Streptomyces macrosporus TaxID=44032 RepID=A0ABP5X5T4_9ACTN